MEPIKALIFGIDDLFPTLKPYYDREVEKGNLEIVGYAVFQGNNIIFVKNLQGEPLQELSFQKIIISSQNNFMPIYKAVKAIFKGTRGGGITLDNVIDGRIFQIPNFDFLDFCQHKLVQLKMNDNSLRDLTFLVHPRIYNSNFGRIALGIKSYIAGCSIDGLGFVHIGNYSSIASNITFELGTSGDHNHHNISSYGLSHWGWTVSKDFYINNRQYGILNIGSDVWIGRGSYFKASNFDKPLIIGNGAVVASDSVVVKDVPPYAIVGGNPAKFIKWRFDREIIEALERIAWWNWDLEKIYDNFQLFNNPKEFVKKFDPQYNE